jgi:hypothetical protein
MKFATLAVIPGLLALHLPVAADELQDVSLQLCEKVKSCALAQMQEQDLTPEVREMMQPMLEGMCTDMQGKVEDVPRDHPLYKPALECMRSMANLSCAVMQDADRVRTPECENYERLARDAAGES